MCGVYLQCISCFMTQQYTARWISREVATLADMFSAGCLFEEWTGMHQSAVKSSFQLFSGHTLWIRVKMRMRTGKLGGPVHVCASQDKWAERSIWEVQEREVLSYTVEVLNTCLRETLGLYLLSMDYSDTQYYVGKPLMVLPICVRGRGGPPPQKNVVLGAVNFSSDHVTIWQHNTFMLMFCVLITFIFPINCKLLIRLLVFNCFFFFSLRLFKQSEQIRSDQDAH